MNAVSNAFVNSVTETSNQNTKKANITTTANGAKAFKSTLNANVDFFGKVGAMRGRDITELFAKALEEDSEMALRNMFNLRDIRGGKGERELYRQVLKYLAIHKANIILHSKVIQKTAKIGRWDDLLVLLEDSSEIDSRIFNAVIAEYKKAIEEKNTLVCKWLPRKGVLAARIRNAFGWTPKFYRKTLVNLTNVVETRMCANDWENINYSHVPSKAMTIYSDAFSRHAIEKFNDYKLALVTGEAKINASAVFPYEVYKQVMNNGRDSNQIIFETMWNNLPNYISAEANIIPMIDVSGSMQCSVGNGQKNITCMDMSISLGAYVASKGKGVYNGLYLTFDSTPVINTISKCSSVYDMFETIRQSDWGFSTDIEKAFAAILEVAVKGKVPENEMPTHLIIFSDMQFDESKNGDKSALKMAKSLYKKAGYELPKIIFWNLNAYDNVPVKFDSEGTALVSGYSPSILTAILSMKFEEAANMTPKDVMLEALMNERYNPF